MSVSKTVPSSGIAVARKNGARQPVGANILKFCCRLIHEVRVPERMTIASGRSQNALEIQSRASFAMSHKQSSCLGTHFSSRQVISGRSQNGRLNMGMWHRSPGWMRTDFSPCVREHHTNRCALVSSDFCHEVSCFILFVQHKREYVQRTCMVLSHTQRRLIRGVLLVVIVWTVKPFSGLWKDKGSHTREFLPDLSLWLSLEFCWNEMRRHPKYVTRG